MDLKFFFISQRDFNMAITWWMATGISHKMESDVRDQYFGQAYWVPQSVLGEEVPLEINHVLLSFMILGVGLVFSKSVFFCELMFHKIGKQDVGK